MDFSRALLNLSCCPAAPFCLPQYMPTIWGLLFSRLQSSRTAKFTRCGWGLRAGEG